MTLYRISKDMSHASGYNFNATIGMVDVAAQKVLLYTFKLMIYFVVNASETLTEHGVENNVTDIVLFLRTLMTIHVEAIDKIYKEQMEADLEHSVS